MNVTIYVETTIQGPAKRSAAGMYEIEYILKNGEPVTREDVIYKEKTTEQELNLILIELALKRLTKSCSVLINIRCEGILYAVENGWLEKWAGNDFKKANGKPVQNAGLWQQIYELMQKHEVLFDNGGNSYRPAMELKMKEELRRNGHV